MFLLLFCELDIGAYLSVILEVGKGGLSGELVRIEVGFGVTSGKYPMYDELG